MSADGIHNACHHKTENNVTIEVASLSNGSRHNCGTCCSKGALEEHEGKVLKGHVNQGKVCVTNKRCSFSKCECIAHDKECSDAFRNYKYLLNPLFIFKLPMQRSEKFLIKMLVTFLLLTDPASRNPKPACNSYKIVWIIWRYKCSLYLHQDYQGSIDQ